MSSSSSKPEGSTVSTNNPNASGPSNARGIPPAPFITNVEEFLGSPDEDVEGPLKSLQEMLAKYRFMEQNTLTRRQGYDEKEPELKRTLEVVEMLEYKKEHKETLETTFELADTLYAHGEVEEVDEVHLWLGANTMLSYTIPEAKTLLNSKLVGIRQSQANAREDLEFLREQITVTEVNIARLFNWDVKRRREARLREGGKTDEKKLLK